MKDTKSVLKEAREAIKNKDYETSLRLCKQVLKEKPNYTALVFLGVSLHETGQPEQGLKAFKDAIKTDPSNPLAWNGIVNYYEKADGKEAKSELVQAYISLMKSETTEKKLAEYCRKLSELRDFGAVPEMASAIRSAIEGGKCAEPIELWVSLVNLLSKTKDLPPDLSATHKEALTAVLSNKKTVCVAYYADYLTLLYREDKIDELFEHAKKMHALFELDSVSLQWICKIFNEAYAETGTAMETPEAMRGFSDDLLKLEAQSPTARFTKSVLLLLENKPVEARDLLKEVVASCPGLLYAWILLAKVAIKLRLFSDAMQALSKAEKLLKSSKRKNLQQQIDVLAVESLSNSEAADDLNRVVEMCDSLSDETRKTCLQHLIRANIGLKKFAQAKLLLEEIKNDSESYRLLTAQLLRKQGKCVEALQLLQDGNVASSEWWIEVGILHWDSGRFEEALKPFLKAVKFDSTNYKWFLLLGHCYKKLNEPDKARRCYEKAFKINPQCTEAGIELSNIYRKLKSWNSNSVLLESIITGSPNKTNCWAWMQLGLNYLEQGEYDKAVNNLRLVIRIEENNMHCWECLADAYLAKGAYTSALKCYAKASELSSGTLYPSLQMANIKQILGEYAEARADFEEILLSNKHYVPALKGISETCMYQAWECYKSQRTGTARDHAQFAADKLIIAVQQRGDLSCLWKLLGDACVFVTKLPEKFCCLLLQECFVDNADVDRRKNKALEKDELFTLATRCYCKSLSLAEENALIWHDLAYCYFSHASSTPDGDLAAKLMGKAEAAAHHCATKNPTNWQHWNLLGNIAFHKSPPNYRLAQHAFIKAVMVDKNAAVAWGNLGTLYLILEDYKLANEAFSQAQRSDPNYVNSWIGQAILAEILEHEDAMDLFRHSTQLGFHQQGALGYGHWVCHTLKKSPLDAVIYSIHNMHAVPVACDNMNWYAENNPDNSAAWNMLGILRERMGLTASAAEAFRNALYLTSKENEDLAMVNYGRLLTKLGRYPEATEIFRQVKEATFNSGSGLALSLFKDGHYHQSYDAYEQALHWLTEEQSFQSDLLVALGSMAYMFQDPHAAKTLLFQSFELDKPSPWAFYATLAFGLLRGDLNLAQLVFNELKPMKDRKDVVPHYAILTACLCLMQGDPSRSIREVSKLVHRHPDQACIWVTLSSLLVNRRGLSAAAARCAQIAVKLGRNNVDMTKVLCLVSLASFIGGDQRSSLLTAQKAVHCSPDVAECWALLASALLVANRVQASLARRILLLVDALSTSDALTNWTRQTISLL